MKRIVIITGPALRADKAVSGISTIINMLMERNNAFHYIHFEVGKRDEQPKGIFRIYRNLRGLWKWNKLLNDLPDAIVHYNFPMARMAILRDPLYMWLARSRGKKVLLHMHGGDLFNGENVGTIYKLILRWAFGMCDEIVGPSFTESRILEKRYSAKNVIPLPNSVDTVFADQYQRDYSNATIRPLRFGYLGRLEYAKGMEEIIEAFSNLKKQSVAFELHLAGSEINEGEYVPRFENAFGDNFYYHGPLMQEEKYEFLKLIDVFVMPTHFDGLSMSLQECMSMGVVPVVTSVGPIPELVKTCENGILVRRGSVEDVIKAVRTLDADRDLLRKLGTNARKTILTHSTAENYISRLNSIYEKLVEQRGCELKMENRK